VSLFQSKRFKKVARVRQKLQYDFSCALFFILKLFSLVREFLVKEFYIEVIYMNAPVSIICLWFP
jgi:hypothetical protein